MNMSISSEFLIISPMDTVNQCAAYCGLQMTSVAVDALMDLVMNGFAYYEFQLSWSASTQLYHAWRKIPLTLVALGALVAECGIYCWLVVVPMAHLTLSVGCRARVCGFKLPGAAV